ncbi:hypothetical protein DVH24_011866 [Malus domestica]|uniref:Transposase MuDR plant domain-containing protein n=1 Tax=Malus domestica TaxID=3750 RepID=A0A498JGN7_MALDO|nr:hypothetical protein DVH24_011866 [Malus domestica]
MEIQNGLKPLMTDSDVINMCKFVPNHTLIDVYIEKITPEECVSQEMKFMKSFESVAQSMVVIEELDGDDDDQCNLIEERPVQVNRGKGKLAIEYPVIGLGGECSVPSQCVTQVVEEVLDERDDNVDAQEDAVLASIKEQNNPQSGEGSRQQREEFEEEIDVDLVGKSDYNSDSLHNVHEDEDDGPSNSEHYHEFNKKTDIKNPHLSLRLIFKDAAQFKKAVVMHSMINGYRDVHFPQNEKFKVDAACKESCMWLVKCGKMRN